MGAAAAPRVAAAAGNGAHTVPQAGGAAAKHAEDGAECEAQDGEAVWSRGEAARLLTAAIILDWTSPAGGHSWPAAAGFRPSRVAETTARLGTEWFTEAAAAEQLPRGRDQAAAAESWPGSQPDAPYPAVGRAVDVKAVQEVDGVHSERGRSRSRQRNGDLEADQRAVAQHEEDCRNPGRLVVPRAALIAWLDIRASLKA